jgi:hypothetical protein
MVWHFLRVEMMQRRVKQAVDAQADLDSFVGESRIVLRFPLDRPYQFIAGLSQISSQPRTISAA